MRRVIWFLGYCHSRHRQHRRYCSRRAQRSARDMMNDMRAKHGKTFEDCQSLAVYQGLQSERQRARIPSGRDVRRGLYYGQAALTRDGQPGLGRLVDGNPVNGDPVPSVPILPRDHLDGSNTYSRATDDNVVEPARPARIAPLSHLTHRIPPDTRNEGRASCLQLRSTRRDVLASSAAAGAVSLFRATAAAAGSSTIRPFSVNVPEEALVDLRRRIAATRWPDKETVDDRSQGKQLAKLQEIVRYWGTDYDWRKVEARAQRAAAVHDRDRRGRHSFHSRAIAVTRMPCRSSSRTVGPAR